MKKPTPSLASVARPPSAVPAPHVIEAHEAVHGRGAFVRLSVNLPTEVHRQLKLKATAEGRSIKELVLQLVGDYVNRS